jgi:hypothetical protein
MFSKVAEVSPEFIAPAEHVLTKQAQLWIDAIDSTLRMQDPDGIKNTPEPRPLILGVADLNAYVSQLNVCYTGVNVLINSQARGEVI